MTSLKGAGYVDWACNSAYGVPVERSTVTVSRISFSVDMPVDTTRGVPEAAACRSSVWLVRSAEAIFSAGTP